MVWASFQRVEIFGIPGSADVSLFRARDPEFLDALATVLGPRRAPWSPWRDPEKAMDTEWPEA